MNVSPSSNSTASKTSSLLDMGSAASKVEETGDSKGFFESFKEALSFEESDKKAALKDTESASKPEGKQTSAEGGASSEKANSESAGKMQGDSAEPKSTDATSDAQAKQAATTIDAEKTSVEGAMINESGVEQTSELDSQSKGKTSSNMTGDDTSAETVQSKGEQLQVASTGHNSAAELKAKDAYQANAAMSEGNKLLGQLDEANKTLNQTSNGKGLPQQAQGNIAGAPITSASVAGLAIQQNNTALLSQTSNASDTSGNPTAIDWDNADSNEAKALAAMASTAAVATAAQQATSQASSQSVTNALADKAAMLHANNAHAAQQAAAQQASLASPQQQAALDPALTAQGVPMNAAPAATKAGSTDMLLKAGAGAAALSGLGKAGAKEDSKDSTFAQQIASAAGVQGAATAGSAPTRAEIQAAQQAPLQLTKELANEQVAEKVQMMMSKNLKNLDIRLDPPELGQMKIRMTMNNDVANVHFTVSNQQARDVIEQTLPRLREMLAQQGMQLADSSVQQQSSGQGQDSYSNGEQQSGPNRTNDGQGDDNLDSSSNLELNVSSKRDGISYYA